jgi:hypothetical protein
VFVESFFLGFFLGCVCDTLGYEGCTFILVMTEYRVFFQRGSVHSERFLDPAVLRQRLLLNNVEDKVQALRSLQLNSLSMWFSKIDYSIEVSRSLKYFSDL